MKLKVFVPVLIAFLFLGTATALDSCDGLNEKIDLLLKQNATMNKELMSSTAKVNEASDTMNKNAGLIKDTNNNQVQISNFLISMNEDLPVRTFVLTLVLMNVAGALLLILILRGTVYPFIQKSWLASKNNSLSQANQLLKQQNKELKQELMEFHQGRVA